MRVHDAMPTTKKGFLFQETVAAGLTTKDLYRHTSSTTPPLIREEEKKNEDGTKIKKIDLLCLFHAATIISGEMTMIS